MVYKEVPNADTRFTLMRSGQAQWTEELTLRQIAELKKDKRVKIESDQGTGHVSLRMSPTIKLFDNPLLRQAPTFTVVRLRTDHETQPRDRSRYRRQ